MKVVALAGGTGSAKLIRGLSYLGSDLTVVANIGDNFWFQGVLVCPDIDIATYSLAGISSRKTGWGLEGDTFGAMNQLARLGGASWFRLGDKDLATCMLRTGLVRDGSTLTSACDFIRRALGVSARVLPVSDDDVQTHVRTPRGLLHLQEFWVKERGRPKVSGVSYVGSEAAKVTKEVREAVSSADSVVVCPANPVTSIGPMLAVPGFESMLKEGKSKVAALSPMVGSGPFSGPAGKLMKALGMSPDSVGVAQRYSGFARLLLVAKEDAWMAKDIERLGVECRAVDTRIASPSSARRLVRELLRS